MSEPYWIPLGATGGSGAPKTVRVPIDLRNPRGSSNQGNSFFTVVPLSAHDFGHWEFVKDVLGQIYGLVAIPLNLAPTPNAKIVLDLCANATSGVTRMGVATYPVAVDGLLNPGGSFNAEASVDVTVPAAAYQRKLVTVPMLVAPGPPASTWGGVLLLVELTHNGAHANDTLAVNTILTGAYLEVDVV